MSRDVTLTSEDLDGLRIEGSRGFEDLCKLAEMLGYRRERYGQLQNRNGSFVSSLMDFFEDNPGCIEAIHEWVRTQYAADIEANDESAESEDTEDETEE